MDATTVFAFVLGGLVTAILAKVGEDLWTWFKRRVLRLSTADSPVIQVISGDVATGPIRRQLTYRQIVEQVRAAPLAQQDEAGKNFRGMRVDWLLQLSNIFKRNDELLVVFSTLKREDKALWLASTIRCVVPERDYPELKVAHAGEEFRVEGDIKDVEGAGVDLTNVRLTPL